MLRFKGSGKAALLPAIGLLFSIQQPTYWPAHFWSHYVSGTSQMKGYCVCFFEVC